MNTKLGTSKQKHARIFLTAKGDKLTDEALKACKVLHIDQKLLFLKPKEAFKEKGVTDEIAEIRFLYNEEKRKGLINEIERYISVYSTQVDQAGFMRR